MDDRKGILNTKVHKTKYSERKGKKKQTEKYHNRICVPATITVQIIEYLVLVQDARPKQYFAMHIAHACNRKQLSSVHETKSIVILLKAC